MRVTSEAKAATLAKIVEVAQELFVAKGFDATTTRDIAQAAQIATGTLFNYFPTKEAIVMSLVAEALLNAEQDFLAREAKAALHSDAVNSSFEEDLFGFISAGLRKLKPFRSYVTPALETVLCPMTHASDEAAVALRDGHLAVVTNMASKHGQGPSLTSLAQQLYWTLYTGVVAFWAHDKSPKQEDTLAVLDQSLAMFVGWLNAAKT